MSVVAVEQIVIELCKETGEPGLHNGQVFYGAIFDAIRDLSLHNMPTWETVKNLPLNSYNAIDWPCSCVKPLITFIERDGRAFALDVDDNILGTINNKIQTFEEADCEIQDFFRIDGFDHLHDYFQTWNWGLGEVYGYGSGYRSIGMVTHDKNRRQSFVKGCTVKSTDTFGMMMKSDGLSNAQYVPSEAKEAIEYFALAKYFRTRNPDLGELNRKNYKEEFRRLQIFSSDEGESSWIDAIRSNYRSSPKD